MKYDIYLESFRQFIKDCPEENLDESRRYVFLSDLHMGNGSSRDDLAANRALLETLLADWYLKRDYTLILNGDVEDLNKFPLSRIRSAWPRVLELIGRFAERGQLRKIVGNHDYDLLLEREYPWHLYEGLVYRYGKHRLFVFHGHQASSLYVRFDFFSAFMVRWFLRPLHIPNVVVSKDSRRRFRTEKQIYRAARALGVAVVTGHTHRPLFESLSKYDTIRLSLERLLEEYLDADEAQRSGIEAQIRMYRDELRALASAGVKKRKNQSLYGSDPFLIPCIFNSGCATGKHGINTLEIADGVISLVYWTALANPRPYLVSEALDRTELNGGVVRYTLRSDRLDSVFARIAFLGDTAEAAGESSGV